MNYYKLIKNNEFVGVGTSYDFRRYQLKHGILLVADENSSEYIQINDKLYRDHWLTPVVTDKLEYEGAQIISISKDEYDALYEAVEIGAEIPIEEPIVVEEPQIDPNEEITIEYVKKMKSAEMSACCNKAIISGFDLVLSDGENHHFSLTIQDQLNMITASLTISTGATKVPYHADGELFKDYSAEDMTVVIDAANAHKAYHTAYFNSLKTYINALDDMQEITGIEYGMSIPEAYQSDVLKHAEIPL